MKHGVIGNNKMSNILSNYGRLVKHVSHSVTLTTALKASQESVGIPVKKLVKVTAPFSLMFNGEIQLMSNNFRCSPFDGTANCMA